MTAQDANPLLDPQDLIFDHEITTTDTDRLAHSSIAQQLAVLVAEIPDRSNVALYGSWGSGKSSVANLLRSALENRKHSGQGAVRFARFDAFKYAETPLRRNFISAIASDLGIAKDQRFHSDLYASSTSTRVNIDAKSAFAVFKTFLVLLGILVGVLAVLIALISWARVGDWWPSRHDWWKEFRSLAGPISVRGLVPTALLSGIVAFGTRSFSVDRKSEKPDSDEEFETLFRALVKRANAQRLVVFVDELDRCSANTVANTLDTIRTFFGVDGCVFVVAADRQVLEAALTRAEGTQETPHDPVNPYYSTGSAYLDKVFQYQVTLPPLLPHRVTKFALDLVEGRGGVWSEINTRFVVSVLVPSHVTSPRRVKHLLNTFALTYRLAQDRHRCALLAEDPAENAGAVARLVCLMVEFPLFARVLEVDARLPQHVLLRRFESAPGPPPAGVSRRAWDLALEFAKGDALVAEVLAVDDPATPHSDEAAEVGKQHAQQLLDYLTRTRDVEGPSRDLVYLHSAGTTFGLDGELATAIERAAEDGDIEEIASRMTDLDEVQQEAALELLVEQIRTGIGVGATNAAKVLLGVIGRDSSLPLDAIADDAAAAISHVHRSAKEFLDPTTAAQAWVLAKHGTESGSKVLRGTVLEVATSPGWEEYAGFLLDDPEPALDADHKQTGQLVSRVLVSDDARVQVARLSTLSDLVLERVVAAAAEPLSERLRAAIETHAAWKLAQDDKATTAALTAATRRTPATATAEDSDETSEDVEPLDVRECVQAITSLAVDRAQSAPRISNTLLVMLLNLDATLVRDEVESQLQSLSIVTDPSLIACLLQQASRRVISRQSQWFAAIDAGAIQATHATALRSRGEELWTAACEGKRADEVPGTLATLVPLLSAMPPDLHLDLTDIVLQDMESPFADESTAEQTEALLNRIPAFISASLVDETRVANHICQAAAAALLESRAVVDTEDSVFGLLSNWVTPQLAVLSDSDDPDIRQVVDNLCASIEACDWLPDFTRDQLWMHWIDASRIEPTGLAVPTAAHMAELLDTDAVAARPLIELWVKITHPGFADFKQVYEGLLSQNAVSVTLADAVDRVRSDWSESEQLSLLEESLGDPAAPLPSGNVLRIVGLSALPDSVVADVLIQRYAQTTTNQQREAVVDLWSAAAISDDPTRKRLIESIVLPMLTRRENGRLNKGAVEVALAALAKLGVPLPYGPKGAIGAALKAVIEEDSGLAKRTASVAEALGFRTSGGWFSRKRVNLDDD